MSLTPKQQRFVEEYLVDLNAAAAARRAGYSERTADRIGHENLKKPEISAAVQEAKSARSERVEVTQDWILTKLVENVERAMQAEPVLDHEGEPTGEYRYAGNVVNKALELLGKHTGFFEAERIEVSGPGGAPMEILVTRRIVRADD